MISLEPHLAGPNRDIDQGQDQIFLIEMVPGFDKPKKRRIGFRMRSPGAPINLTRIVSQSVFADILRTVAQYDAEQFEANTVEAQQVVSSSTIEEMPDKSTAKESSPIILPTTFE